MALIEAKNLTKIYHTGETETPALRGASFTIQEGEFVAIMGPSGSGKSTLLHIIGFLDRQTDGEYRFNGKTWDDLTQDQIAHVRNKEMGFVFQAFNLLPRATVLENVTLPLIYSNVKKASWEKMALKAIESGGLSHRVEHTTAQLSGGEKQRAAIARALVNQPRVIFADEPTGNLDSKSGKQVMEILQQLNDNYHHTIILVTHETYTAEHAKRIIHMYDGKVDKDTGVDHRHRAHDEFKK